MHPHAATFNPALEGLRGLAILLVLFFHALPGVLSGGFIGVDIFFVLSGFLITRILVDERLRRQHIDLPAFYIRRALRLAPALLLMLGAFAIAVPFIFPAEHRGDLWKEAAISAIYMTNWARALDLHSFQFLGHTWSLAIEEQFYLLWPGLLYLLSKRGISPKNLGWMVLGIAATSALLRAYLFFKGDSPMRVYNGLDTRADGLMLGAGLALLLCYRQEEKQDKPFTWLKIGASAALAALMLLALKAEWDKPWMIYCGYSLTGILSLCLIANLSLNSHSLTHAIFSNPAMRWVGRISYGLYLWHFPIYCLLLKAGLSQWQTLLAGIPLSFATAAFSYYLVEQPFLRLKKRYSP